jgi:RNA polymerase sigma-70 factor (ECF subfamily)
MVDIDIATELGTATIDESDLDLRLAVKQLPPKQRESIALFYYAQLPIAEISNLMNCQVGTVKSNLAAGRAALARLLGENDG